jgi:hypothetical protein
VVFHLHAAAAAAVSTRKKLAELRGLQAVVDLMPFPHRFLAGAALKTFLSVITDVLDQLEQQGVEIRRLKAGAGAPPQRTEGAI